MKLKDALLAVFVVLTWGSYFTVGKIIMDSFPPLFFGALRFFLMFLFTCPFFFKNKLFSLQVVVLSVITFLNLLTLNHAINISSNLSPIILLNELAVPFSTLLGIYFLKEKLKLKDCIGIIVAITGSAIIAQKCLNSSASTKAVILIIIASLLFAFYNLLAKKLAHYNILSLLSQISLLIAAQFFLASFWQEDWPAFIEIEPKAIFALLYLVTICSLLSYYIWFYLLSKYPLGKVVPFTLLSPVFGCITAIVTLNENIDYRILFGGFLVILGIIIIELKDDRNKS
jgi:O-acetylserine/cysteine efflux transporter